MPGGKDKTKGPKETLKETGLFSGSGGELVGKEVDRFEVVDPGCQDEDVGAISMGHEDIGNDLLQPVLVGDERPVDLSNPARRRWIGVSGVAESSGV